MFKNRKKALIKGITLATYDLTFTRQMNIYKSLFKP